MDEYGKLIREILAEVRVSLPDFYNKKLRGQRQREAFMAKYSPPLIEGIVLIEKLGYLNKDLRMLWLLQNVFGHSADAMYMENKELLATAPFPSRPHFVAVTWASMFTAQQACNLLFWEAVKKRFARRIRPGINLFLKEDWSVWTKEPNTEVPTLARQLAEISINTIWVSGVIPNLKS